MTEEADGAGSDKPGEAMAADPETAKAQAKAEAKADAKAAKAEDKADAKAAEIEDKADAAEEKADQADAKADDNAEAKANAKADGVPDPADADAEIPKTRQHGAPRAASAAAGPAAGTPAGVIASVEPPIGFPDDGAAAQLIRKIDRGVALAEQALLFGVLFIVVLSASGHAIKEKLTDQGLWWSYDIVRGGTFVLAMMGAAFATHQSRHLAMDLISRRLPPRARLVLTALLEVFTIAICLVLARSGFHQVAAAGKETGRHLIEASNIAMFLPIGAGLIIFHAALHLIIDIDYLMRGKVLPERARSGH